MKFFKFIISAFKDRNFIVALFAFITLNNASVEAGVIDWENLGQPNSSVLSSGAQVSSTNNTCAPGIQDCDVTATVTFEIDNDGQGGELVCGWGSGTICGAYFSGEFGGINDDDIRFGLNATGADNDDRLNVCVAFDRVVEGLTFDILDVDDAGWDDVVELYYTSDPSATPMLDRTDLINAIDFGDVSTGNDANHVVEHRPNFASPNNEATGWGAIQPGGGNAGNSDDGGNITIDFGSTRVWGVCMRYWAGPNSDSNPPFQWVGLSAFNWTSTNPVNLDFFASYVRGNRLDVDWSTSSESFNIGFNFWGEVDGQWVALNSKLIPSQKIDSHSQLEYERSIRLGRNNRNITRVGISSVDATGKEEFYGPFDLNQEYGDRSLPEPIAWDEVVAQKAQAMQRRGFVKKNGRWVRESRLQRSALHDDLRVDIAFSETGITRITHSDLLKAGIDLRGKFNHEIAVSYRGKPVPRWVRTGRGVKTFEENSFIDFRVDIPADSLSLYNGTNVYQISINSDLAMPMRRIKLQESNPTSAEVQKTVHHEVDKLYLNASTTGSPWLEQMIGYGSGATKEIKFDLPKTYVAGSSLELTLNMMGGFDFPTVEDDHKLTVKVNGHDVFENAWGGIDAQEFAIEVASQLLQPTGNTVTLTAIDNQAGIALLLFDKHSLTFSVENQLDTLKGSFKVLNALDNRSVSFEQSSKKFYWAYGYDEQGNTVRLQQKRNYDKASRKMIVTLPALQGDAHYWVSNKNEFVKPAAIEVKSNQRDSVSPAQLYIVADETFFSNGLNDYVEFKRATGITTELVSYQAIIEQYGYGMNDPMAINEFLKSQTGVDQNTALLIVGGHTFDYLNKSGQGSVSFIPTVYRPSNIIQHSPTDTPIVDLDEDGLADVAVGRWPVRSQQQLEIIIEKSKAWAIGEGLALSSDVLLISEADDQSRGISFTQQLSGLTSRFDSQAPTYKGYWSSTNTLFAANYLNSATAINDQKADIKDAMNQGNALTIYSGHGSPTSWSYRRLMDVNTVTSLEENGLPGIIVPLACYTTYYETISNESLANKLLFKPNGGAVMIAGAATLGDYTTNGKMVARMMKFQARDNVSMGQALKLAKRSMGNKNLQHSNLWTMLGDPTLKFNADYRLEQNNKTKSSSEMNGANQLLH